MKKTEFLHGRHCVYNLHVHLVFVIKYRRKVLTAAILILGELRNIFSLVCVRFESKLLEFDGEADHVHLPVSYPPKVTISKLVQALKGYSSLIIRKKNYPSIQKIFGRKLFGHHPILHAVVEEPQFLLLDNI